MMDVNLLQSSVTVQMLTPTAPLAAVQQQEDEERMDLGGHFLSSPPAKPLRIE